MNERPGEPAADRAPESTFSTRRRALLKAGWVTPMIVAVSLPVSGFAANASGNVGEVSDGETMGSEGESIRAGDLDRQVPDRVTNPEDDNASSNAIQGAGVNDDVSARNDADPDTSSGGWQAYDGDTGSGRGRNRRLKRGVRPKVHARDKGEDER